jgi:hypothetical protein
MGQWLLRELNKIDRPYKLLIWFDELGKGTMTIRKIREEEDIIIGLPKNWNILSEKELSVLPYKIEAEVAKKLKVKGSLPYEIRTWVSSALFHMKSASEKSLLKH